LLNASSITWLVTHPAGSALSSPYVIVFLLVRLVASVDL